MALSLKVKLQFDVLIKGTKAKDKKYDYENYVFIIPLNEYKKIIEDVPDDQFVMVQYKGVHVFHGSDKVEIRDNRDKKYVIDHTHGLIEKGYTPSIIIRREEEK